MNRCRTATQFLSSCLAAAVLLPAPALAADPACNNHGTLQPDGSCVCDVGFVGATCNQCGLHYYGPSCTFCEPTTTCSGHGFCDPQFGGCICQVGYAGASCSQCAANYYGAACSTFCQASTTCNGNGTCDLNGSCVCAVGFAGPTCSQCAANYYGATCTFCQASTTCNGNGTCSATGACTCNPGFNGPGCTAVAGGTITTIAGGGTAFPGDGGLATGASLWSPMGIVADQLGIYFVDYDQAVVRRVDAGGIISTVAGSYVVGDSGDGGPATAAMLTGPIGLAVDAAGDLYIADQGAGRIRKVTTATGTITTVAGNGTIGLSGDGGQAILASFSLPEGVACDGSGNVYVADTGNQRVRKIAPNGIITTLAGGFSTPKRVAVDAAGNVYVFDQGATALVRRITPGGTVTTIAGGGTSDGASGSALSANLGPAPGGNISGAGDVAVDGSGNLYIGGDFTVWKVVLATGEISIVAGTGVQGFSGDGGPATSATLNVIWGVAVASTGDLFLSDLGNGRVRKVAAPVPPPPPVFDGTISLTTSQSTLDSLTLVTGSISLVNVAGYTSLTLPNLTGVTVDFTVSGNPDLTLVSTPVLSTVGGSLTVSNNPALSSVDMSSVTTVTNNLSIEGNTGASTVSVGTTTAGGSISVSGNTSASTVSVGTTTTTGSVSVIDNPLATVTIGVGSTVGGDLTVETTGTTVDFTTTTVAGNVDVTGTGTTTLSATTGGLSTTVELVNTEATMVAHVPTGATTGQVGFTITHVDPNSLPPETGVSFTGTTVTVDPVTAYNFNFAIPTLNADATLVFDVILANLSATDRSALLTALASGSATLAVKNDTIGSVYLTFPVCTGTAVPTAGGCVSIITLDAAGNPTSGTPTTVRFASVAGHFSTWAVVIATPIPVDTTPPVFSNVPAPIVAEATGPSGATVIYTPPSATDDVSGAVSVTCELAPGSVFPLETTTVTCSASDAAGNPATATFTVGVVDTTPPVLSGIPANITVTATSTSGAVVTWPAPTATDLVSGSVPVTCTPASGSTFAVGTTPVTCTASDALGNTASAGFTVSVQPMPPPPTGNTKVLYGTLGGTTLLDVDAYSFKGTKGEKVTVRLAPDSAGTYQNGRALLSLAGVVVLKTDGSTLPNVVSATLPTTGTYYVTVSELPVSGRFKGAYTVSLESTGNAWSTFK